jgi:hypothetical protein
MRRIYLIFAAEARKSGTQCGNYSPMEELPLSYDVASLVWRRSERSNAPSENRNELCVRLLYSYISIAIGTRLQAS